MGVAREPVHEAVAEEEDHPAVAVGAGQKDAVHLEEPGLLQQRICWGSDVRDNGLSQAIELANTVGVEVPQSPRELINFLCGLSSVDTDADFDSEAANAAQRKLLSEIFKSCENLTDAEEIIKQANKDTIDAWIIDFEVNYIIEFQGSLFQSHIFDKAQDPEKVAGQIRRWLHSKLDKRLSDEMKHINLFSEEGKRYVESLTAKILDIWKQ